MTKNSGIDDIDDLMLWLETTLPQSFIESEAQEGVDLDNSGADDGISVWYDLQNSSSKHNATQGTDSKRPLYYKNCMNSLPCLRFDGSNDNLDVNLTELTNGDYTIFVVEQRRASAAGVYLGESGTPTENQSLELGYHTDGKPFFSQGDITDYYTFGTSPAIATYSSPITRLNSFLNPIRKSGVSTVYHYLNGSSTASTLTLVGSPSFAGLSYLADGTIGVGKITGPTTSYYNGDIGEIMIYKRALEKHEREAVENYLLKKWKISSL